MLAREFMSKPVISVKPDTPIHVIASILAEQNISGVPVIDDTGRLFGVISEGDLLYRQGDAKPKGKWWLNGITGPDAAARNYVKAHGQKASDVMSRAIVSISEATSIAEAAQVMSLNGVKRLPVLRDGAVVGMLTRRDIVRALADAEGTGRPESLSNATVQKAIVDRMRKEAWLDASYVTVVVSDDSIELRGAVTSTDQRKAAEVLAADCAQSREVRNLLDVGLPLVSDFV